jgi:two-component system, OmpR family, phosphate regulon sensor histidine kinase PhoR
LKKAIFHKFILILLLALIFSGSIFGAEISKIIMNKTSEDMLYALRIADHSLDYDKDLKNQLDILKEVKGMEDSRFTIIDFNGKVLADSDIKNASLMENHKNREEVKEALKTGTGYSKRNSDTLGKAMMYVAILSSDGNCILRMAVPFSGVEQYIGSFIPSMLLAIGLTLLISVILARRFSQSITKPLHEIAEEMLKLKEAKPEFHFKDYQYEEMNVIANTTMQMSKAVKESMDRAEFERMVRQEFFSNASHELKTPITSIRGYIELLENNMVTDEKMKKDFLSRIKKETTNMTNLINDILMISRLETKEAEVVLSEVRICPLLKEVCDSLEPLAVECQVTIETNCRPLTMHANTQQLRELFGNLMNNAIKYNKPGGKVYVTVTSESNDIVIIIEDTGVGIPEDARQRVFERFYRVDKGRSKKMGGTGLGLSIVKHVVNYYNGSIELESKMMEGSKFTVRLPKSQAE